MISSVEAPSVDPAEQSRIVAAAAQIYESAPSAEVKKDRFVATRPSLD
jgi:hypothetical protein